MIVSQEPEKFSQKRRIPKVPLIIVALLIGVVGGYVLVNSFAATPTTNCFPQPSTCGYPDATNTGVPAGTPLTASGSITASTNGQVIDGKDVTGTIDIAANNVTVENTRVTSNTTCGPTNACGNYEIKIEDGVTGAVIKNSELRSTAGDTCEHDIRNVGGTVEVDNSYLHGCDSNLYSVGNTTFNNDYGIAKIVISADHVENIYMSDSTLTVNHSTLFNPVEQTAVVFGNTNGGSGDNNACDNHLKVDNNFLVGGGYTIYPCAHASSAGSSSVSITNNRFARCLGTEVVSKNGGNHTCQNGPDTHGYFPNGGSYNVAAYYQDNQTWSGNIWDDNGQSVCADGSSGCAGSGSGGGGTTDTTPPTVSLAAPANNATVSGSVSVAANASDDTGVVGVQFQLDGNNLGSEDTSSPYSTTWNTSGVSNGTHTLTAVARDAAGNTKTSSTVTVTVNNSTGGGSGGGGTQTSNCFPKPSACGYPDATNTGVPAGTALTASGSITASTNGQVISGKDITGQLVIDAPNVTVKDSKIHTNEGGSGSTAIILNNGATNFTLEDSEVYGNGSTTNAPESGVWNHYGDSGFSVLRSYIHGSPDNIEGPANVQDSYLIVDAEYKGAHSENIYLCGAPASVDHSTMYNQSDETSLIFGDGICGSGNQVSVTNSLLAGGGWMLQPDSKGVSAPVTITDNRVGRCLGAVSQDSGGGYVCKGGADGNGYWPYGGHYGLTTDDGKLTWSGNVWDDNSKTICPTQDGTGSCSSGSGGGGSGSDTTPPTVSFASPTNGSTVSGVVTATASASDNVGVTKVQFYVDNASSPAITDTSSPYNYSLDSKTLSNGNHELTAKAYDAAGNATSTSITVKVNNPDTTAPSAPTGVTATATNATTVNLSWNASTDTGTNASGVAKYEVLRGTEVIAEVTGTSYTDNSVVAGTTYSYVIQAVDAAGNISANSNTASVTTPSVKDTTSPSTPTNLSGTATSSSQVNLSWNASTDTGGSGLAGYNVYRDGTKMNSTLITSTTYGDDTATASTTYTYKVEAVDGAGNKSPQTGGVSVTTPSAPDATPPTVPTGLKATAASAAEVDLSWGASTDTGGSGLAGYNVYRDGKELNTAPITGMSYKDANVSAGTTYQYAVQAVDKAGNVSDKSATASATTPQATGGGGGNSGGLLLGSKGIQSTADNDAAGSPEAFRYTAVASGPASTISLYLDKGSAATTVSAGIYSDNNGKPGTLLASGSISAPVSATWNTIGLNSQPNITKGTTYWIALLGTGGRVKFRDASSGTCSQSPAGSHTGLPASWSSKQVWPTCTLSAYVTSSTPASSGGSNGSGNTGSVVPAVSVTVVGSKGHPTSNATVILDGQTAVTDNHGIAQFSRVPTGKQSVAIDYGNKMVTKKVNITPDTKNSSTQHLKVSLVSSTTNPLLLLVPAVILVGAALVIFRPWEGRSTAVPEEPLAIVTSDRSSDKDDTKI